MTRRSKSGRMGRMERLLAAFFALFFAICAAMLIAGIVHARNVRSRLEAQRVALMDPSWIDSPYSLSWTLTQGVSERDADGEWTFADSRLLLRTHSFADGSAEDLSLEDLYGYGAEIVPSDDPRGYVLADRGEGNAWSFYRLEDDGAVVPMFFEVSERAERMLGWYDGRIYCEVYDESYDPRLVCWDRETGNTTLYRGDALCLDARGRAAVLEEQSTGATESVGGDTDAGDAFLEAFREPEGWTLGVEDARGGWTAIASVGADSRFRAVPYAAWLDDDRLLLGACTGEEADCDLFLYTLSTGEIAPWLDQNGAQLRMHMADYFSAGTMAASPDGRYIAYCTLESGFKEPDNVLMIQSLETGRCCRIWPRDAVEADGRRFTEWGGGEAILPVWHK